MASWKSRTIPAFLLAWLALPLHGTDVVDRIVANVNGHILLQSDWEEEISFEAFLNNQALNLSTPDQRKAALDRLIDQELLREQVRATESAPRDLVAARVADVRKQFPEAKEEEGWQGVLDRYGLTASALEKRLSDDIELMRMVESKLRPSIQIDSRAVETYYHNEFLPKLQKTGAKDVALPEVFGRIKALLAEQKMNELISSWLVSLRSESRIEIAGAHNGDQSR
jgi:peptidyl-prolyl cis-trans isomerase SurA